VAVRAGGCGRVSIAGLVATRPDRPPRLLYRLRVHRGRRREPKALREDDYIGLLDGAHQQLGGPLVLVWDNLSVHRSARMRTLIAARPWLTVFFLPTYAPELNPVEGVWSHLKRGLVNLARHSLNQLVGLLRTRLRRIQYRPTLIAGFLAKARLDLSTSSNPSL
jgi:DDE superfamily endonuclease